MAEISEKQIGIMGEREPEWCAVSKRPLRGKHAVTHYKGDGVHYVRVLNQFDHRWPEAAPFYGFPVPEENSAQDEKGFVLEGLNEPNEVIFPDGTGMPILSSTESMQPIARRAPKSTAITQPDIKADGMSKGDD